MSICFSSNITQKTSLETWRPGSDLNLHHSELSMQWLAHKTLAFPCWKRIFLLADMQSPAVQRPTLDVLLISSQWILKTSLVWHYKTNNKSRYTTNFAIDYDRCTIKTMSMVIPNESDVILITICHYRCEKSCETFFFETFFNVPSTFKCISSISKPYFSNWRKVPGYLLWLSHWL